jgi:hypothetical protein
MCSAWPPAEAAYRDCDDWRQALLKVLRGNRDRLEAVIAGLPGLAMSHVEATYLAWIESRCERVAINGLTYNVRHWGGRCATAADAARLDGFISQLPVYRRCAPSIPGTCWRQTGAATDKASG